MRRMNFITIILSIVLGLIPEILYFTLFIIYTKNIKEKRIKLFFLLSLVFILLNNYSIINYVIFIVLSYIILKLLYKKKTQIIDIFIIDIGLLYLTLVSFITSRFINNNYVMYYIMMLINRILLFLPFIFKNKFNILYKKYYSLWNRNYDKKQPIKSITLRNISLFILNSSIFLINIAIIYVINTFQ